LHEDSSDSPLYALAMVFASLLLIYISVRDFYSHIIPNLSVVLLAVTLFFYGDFEIRIGATLIFLIAVFSLMKVAKTGGGDIKLLLVLIAFSHPAISLTSYVWGSLLISGFLILIHRVRTGNFLGNIALAPAICGPFLITLL